MNNSNTNNSKIITAIIIGTIAAAAFLFLISAGDLRQQVILTFGSYQYTFGLPVVLTAAFMLGELSVGIFMLAILVNNKEQLNAYRRQLERKSIDSTESSSKVEVLEAKIKVLETALDNALKGK